MPLHPEVPQVAAEGHFPVHLATSHSREAEAQSTFGYPATPRAACPLHPAAEGGRMDPKVAAAAAEEAHAVAHAEPEDDFQEGERIPGTMHGPAADAAAEAEERTVHSAERAAAVADVVDAAAEEEEASRDTHHPAPAASNTVLEAHPVEAAAAHTDSA